MTDTQIVQMVADGHTVPEISEHSGINKRTLESRLQVLRERCGASTLAQLACKWQALGLVTVNEESPTLHRQFIGKIEHK